MTRINLVPVSELMDQHLFAEFREIKMVPKALQRSITAAQKRYGDEWAAMLLKSIPKEFTLNTGHVKLFYDKGEYLRKRYVQIKKELRSRGINYDKSSVFDPDRVMYEDAWNNDYEPDHNALLTIRQRIQQKIQMKPGWYRKTFKEESK